MEMPPEVRLGLIAAAVVGTIAILLLVFGDRPDLAATIRRLIAGEALPIMSHTGKDAPAAITAPNRSIDQSAQTSLTPQTATLSDTGLDDDSPDIDAENDAMPRISAYLTDQEFLVMLARQKKRGGGYRLSANAIVKTVGGDRTEVLAVIRAVREGPATFPPLSEQQHAARAALQLDQP